jgi:hypothetical protein
MEEGHYFRDFIHGQVKAKVWETESSESAESTKNVSLPIVQFGKRPNGLWGFASNWSKRSRSRNRIIPST